MRQPAEDRKILPGKSCASATPDGSVRHIQLQGVGSFDTAGIGHTTIGTIQDVSEIKRAEERIRHLAYYDGITGLPNRQYFMERLQHALIHARRHHRQLGVLSLDLDQFKRINDTLGHTAGNELLIVGVAAGSRKPCAATTRWRTPARTTVSHDWPHRCPSGRRRVQSADNAS